MTTANTLFNKANPNKEDHLCTLLNAIPSHIDRLVCRLDVEWSDRLYNRIQELFNLESNIKTELKNIRHNFESYCTQVLCLY